MAPSTFFSGLRLSQVIDRSFASVELKKPFDKMELFLIGDSMKKARRLRSPITGNIYPRCCCGKTVYSGVLCYQHAQERNAQVARRGDAAQQPSEKK